MCFVIKRENNEKVEQVNFNPVYFRIVRYVKDETLCAFNKKLECGYTLWTTGLK